jgi:hypothetical protein
MCVLAHTAQPAAKLLLRQSPGSCAGSTEVVWCWPSGQFRVNQAAGQLAASAQPATRLCMRACWHISSCIAVWYGVLSLEVWLLFLLSDTALLFPVFAGGAVAGSWLGHEQARTCKQACKRCCARQGAAQAHVTSSAARHHECALQEMHDELQRLGLPLDDPSPLLLHVYEGLGAGWEMYTVPTGVSRSSTRPTQVGSKCYWCCVLQPGADPWLFELGSLHMYDTASYAVVTSGRSVLPAKGRMRHNM